MVTYVPLSLGQKDQTRTMKNERQSNWLVPCEAQFFNGKASNNHHIFIP